MDDERELPDPADVTKIILDRIPGAYERAEDGRAEAEAGESIPLEDL